MKNMKKKIIAMAMAVSLAFATTAFAAEEPIPDYSKVITAEQVYGTYQNYDFVKGIVSTAHIDYWSGEDVDHIDIGNMFMDGGTHYIRNYSGDLYKVAGNVYYSSDGLFSLMVVFGDDAISVTFTRDDADADIAQLDGVYECISRPDLAHTG